MILYFSPRNFLLAFLSCFAASAPGRLVAADPVYTAGDVLLGVQASSGVGAGSVYVFNLGQGHSYRDAGSDLDISNIGTDLSQTFGINWFTREDVRWGIAGVRTNAAFGAAASAVVNGDPARTLYVSRTASAPGNSPVWVIGSPANGGPVTTAATEMIDAQNGFRFLAGPDSAPRTATSTSGNRGVVQSTGDINSWNTVVDGAPFAVFTPDLEGSFGSAGSLAYLDLYRILGRNDVAGITETAPVGEGRYQGTFSIDGTGSVRFLLPSAGTAYDTWADSSGLAGGNRAGDLDPDFDGLANNVEFVVGGNPLTMNDTDKLPVATRTGDFLDFVFRRTAVSSYLNPGVEFAADLAGVWSAAVNGTGGVVITQEVNGFEAGVDRVTVRIPVAGPSLFARLRVTQ